MTTKNTYILSATIGASLLLACGEGGTFEESTGPGSTSSGGVESTSTNGATTSGGSDGCTPGTPYCPCFEGMCFESLVCNPDSYCIPDSPPPAETGGEEMPECPLGTLNCLCLPGGQCDEGLIPEVTSLCACIEPGQVDECQADGECPEGEICYSPLCHSFGLINWAVEISDRSIVCVDGIGGCELLFYKQKWNWDTESWETANFTALENLLPTDYLGVAVWEDDAFSNDFINGFQVPVGDAIEAWKNGVPYVAIGEDGTDWMEFTFEPL